jgi:hypothetical protein
MYMSIVARAASFACSHRKIATTKLAGGAIGPAVLNPRNPIASAA